MAIDQQLHDKMATSLLLIRQDIDIDATALDGMEVDGKTLGEAFGKILAQVDAVARACEILLHDGLVRTDGTEIK